MVTKEQIIIAETILSTGLVKEVYHSCELIRNEENKLMFPAYKSGKENIYVGVDDTKDLFCYIRNNGSVTVLNNTLVSSCNKSYEVSVPMRAVFFNDNETRDFGLLTTNLSKFIFLKDVFLTRIVRDKYILSAEESTLWKTRFDGNVFYIAIDFTIKKFLQTSSCEEDLCAYYPNPIY